MLVSVIVPTTRSRQRFWPDVLKCFANQTHDEKEIIFIVDDLDERNALQDAISNHSLVTRSSVTVQIVIADRGATLGEKRDAGCSVGRGGYIAHADDDDLYAPNHLANIVRSLETTGAAVAGYIEATVQELRRVRVNGRETSGWWLQRSDDLIGGSLCYRRDWWIDHPFDSVNVGEDNAIIATAAKCGQSVPVAGGRDMYCLRNHTGNVSGRCIVAGDDCVELPDGGVFACS